MTELFDHVTAAEKYLALAESIDTDTPEEDAFNLRVAQIHAILAVVEELRLARIRKGMGR